MPDPATVVASPDPARAAGDSPKRAAILEAAAAVFLEAGVEAASMDEIARRARVSKATVYSHFDGKHALLRAIVHGRCRGLMPAMDSAEFAALAPAQALTLVGRRLLDMMFAPDAVALYRVVLVEAARAPELARAFYENGPDRVARELADYLRVQHAAGRLRAPDPRLAAEQFLGAVLCQSHLRQLLSITAMPQDGAARGAQVQAAVALFLAATRPG